MRYVYQGHTAFFYQKAAVTIAYPGHAYRTIFAFLLF